MAVTTRGGKPNETETEGGAGKKGRGGAGKKGRGADGGAARKIAAKKIAAKKKKKKSRKKSVKSVGTKNRLDLVNIPASEVHSDREYCSV